MTVYSGHDAASSSLRALITQAQHGDTPEGNEAGFLSLECGFQPREEPLQSFPQSHRAWDELMHEVPALLADGKLLSRVAELENLPADAASLPQKYLHRAALVLAKLAHIAARAAQQNERLRPGAGSAMNLAPCLRDPWETVSQRLGRPCPGLTFRDLYLYNWKLRDRTQPRTLDNLTLMCPVYDSETEHNFYLPTIQMHHDAAPLLQAAIDIEEALAARDDGKIQASLSSIFDVLHHLTFNLLLAIDPNPYSDRHVDHLVWAKTVGPFAAPAYPGEIGVSGGGSPIFLFLDALMERAGNRSLLGQAAIEMTREMPASYRQLFQRARSLRLDDYILRHGSSSLKASWQEVIEAYAGDRGWLGIHQLKVYGYMELGFKSGRTQTNGGFKSDIEERNWEDLDEELAEARQERWSGKKLQCPFARRAADTSSSEAQTGPHMPARAPDKDSTPSDVQLLLTADKQTTGDLTDVPVFTRHPKVIRLELSGAPTQLEAGDRIGIRARNGDEIVERCLLALRANGDEIISLSRMWKAHLTHIGHPSPTRIPLREFLVHAHLRPFLRSSAKALHAFCGAQSLRDVIEKRQEDQWELFDALEQIGARVDVQRLWRSEPWQQEHISRWLPPQHLRIYSVASGLSTKDGKPCIELNVGPLQYPDNADETQVRQGAASSFLHSADAGNTPFPASIVRPSRFRLPQDASRPVVMIAGGTGIAPFRSFWQERKTKNGVPDLLLWGTRHWEDIPYQDELQNEVQSGRLDVHIALSRSQTTLRTTQNGGVRSLSACEHPRSRVDALLQEPDVAEMIWRLLRAKDEGGEEAHFYICGRTSFAHSVMDGLQQVIARYSEHEVDAPPVRERIRRLMGEGRLHQEIFTTYAPSSSPGVQGTQIISNAELTRHHDMQEGHWMVVQGNVYDVSEFQHLHPGGAQIIRANSGMDATRSYEATQHHLNPEVHAMLDLYKVGTIRRVDFGSEWGIAYLPETSEKRLSSARVKKKNVFYVTLEDLYKHWVRYLFRITEIKNTIRNNFTLGSIQILGPDFPTRDTHIHQQLVLESLLLFTTDSLPSLLQKRLEKLWFFTAGLCGKDVQLMPLLEATQKQVEALQRAPMWRTMRQVAAGIDVRADDVTELLNSIHERNMRLIDELQELVRRGVEAFETHGENTCRIAGRTLIQLLKEIPEKVQGYQTTLQETFASSTGNPQTRKPDMSSISIIGAGVQGTAVARMMLKDDFDVCVYDQAPSQVHEALEYGARSASDLQAAFAASSVILVIVNAGDAQEKLLCDPALLAACKPHHTVVQMGNASVEGTLRAAQAVKKTGARFVEAVLMGPSGLVLAGECPVAFGGDAKDFAEIATLLDALGPIFSAGELGKAAAFNLAALSAVYGLTHGFSLATAMMEEADLDMETWLSFTKGSVIGNASGFLADFVYPAHLQKRNYDLTGICKVKNNGAAAETDLLVEQAQRLGITSDFLEVMRNAHHHANAQNPNADWTSVYESLRKSAGATEKT